MFRPRSHPSSVAEDRVDLRRGLSLQRRHNVA